MTLIELLTIAIEQRASDLHLAAGLSPILRVDGDLQHLALPALSHTEILALFQLDTKQSATLTAALELDFAWQVPNLARFRTHLFQQQNGLAAAIRIIPLQIPKLTTLALPKILQEITTLTNGLVLITGPTGSGKTTTLAAIIDHINSTQARHIITLEDPIEFLHNSKHCLLNQREIQQHSASFASALRAALRADPDIILVGEMRDLETIRLALTAAETGHLVFATLHTTSAAKTINRIVDVFPGAEKSMVRSLLAESLQSVICQTLLKKNGGGRIAALEIMRCTPAIRNLIREDKVAQMYSVMQTGANVGMQTLDQHLRSLVEQNLINSSVAQAVATQRTLFAQIL